MKQETLDVPHTNVVCEKCGDEKEVYYDLWCPVCEKPELKPIQTLNLIQALRHVRAVSGLDYHNRDTKDWHWFCENCNFTNDSYVHWAPYDQELPPSFEKLVELFNIDREDGVIFHISW